MVPAAPVLWKDRHMPAQTLPSVDDAVIGVLGGTGQQGRGLARRLGMAGHRVVLGSRDEAKAVAAAGAVAVDGVIGTSNAACAEAGDIVIVAVPWSGHRQVLSELREPLAGKLVVDCVNPLGFDERGAYPLPVAEGSAAQQAADLLPESRVVAAFHHVSAVRLLDPAVERVDTDVMVLGDDREATDFVQLLAARVPGMRGIYAGRLRNAGQVEALSANLISVNRRYTAHAGIRVTDV